MMGTALCAATCAMIEPISLTTGGNSVAIFETAITPLPRHERRELRRKYRDFYRDRSELR